MSQNRPKRLIDRVGLKGKVIVLLLTLSLTPLILVGAVTINRANLWGKNSEESHFLRSAQATAAAYSDLFETGTRDLERLALRFPAERIDHQAIRSDLGRGVWSRPTLDFWLDAPFQSMLEQVYSSFFIALPTGEVFFTAPYRYFPEMVNLAQFDWFDSISTRPVIVGTSVDALSGSSRPVILIVMPLISRQGRLVGYLGGQLDEGRVREILRRLIQKSASEEFVLNVSLSNSEGLIIGHSNLNMLGRKLPTEIQSAPQKGTAEIQVANESLLMAAADIPPTDWHVRITAPTHQVYRVVHVLQRLLIVVTLLTFILVVLVADYFARVVLSPIKDSERGARMLGSGSLGYRIELSRHTEDELGHLAEAFNQMAQSLQEKNEDLSKSRGEFENAFNELDTMVSAMTAGIQESVDLISKETETLNRSDLTKGTAQNSVNILSQGAERVAHLNEGLLKLTQSLRRHRTTTEFSAQDMLEKLRIEVTKKYRGQIYLPVDLPRLHGDEERLTEAFRQVIANGLHHNLHPMPTVEIKVKGDEEWHHFTIQDNGVGLPADKFEAAFDLLTRFESGQDTTASGTGLSLSRKIITDHGGGIEFTESKVQQGSTVTIRLPSRGALNDG